METDAGLFTYTTLIHSFLSGGSSGGVEGVATPPFKNLLVRLVSA